MVQPGESVRLATLTKLALVKATVRTPDVAPTLLHFVATLAKPGLRKKSDLRVMHREHRLVVLPDYQGLGIGLRLSEAVGSLTLAKGLRYTSRTAHFVLRNARANSPKWKQVLSTGQKEGQASAATGLGTFGDTALAKKILSKSAGAANAAKASGSKDGGSKSGGGGKATGGEGDDEGEDDADEEADEARMLFTHEFIGDEEQQKASLVFIERAAAAAAAAAASSASASASPRPGASTKPSAGSRSTGKKQKRR